MITLDAVAWIVAIPVHLYLSMYHDSSPAWIIAHGVIGAVLCVIVIVDESRRRIRDPDEWAGQIEGEDGETVSDWLRQLRAERSDQ